jgi:hypothetical protein
MVNAALLHPIRTREVLFSFKSSVPRLGVNPPGTNSRERLSLAVLLERVAALSSKPVWLDTFKLAVVSAIEKHCTSGVLRIAHRYGHRDVGLGHEPRHYNKNSAIRQHKNPTTRLKQHWFPASFCLLKPLLRLT